MQLKDYLEKEDISTPKFAKKLGMKLTTINSYRYNVSIPNKENMQKIFKATKGKVTANDFYGIIT